jgi:hypothetical protein
MADSKKSRSNILPAEPKHTWAKTEDDETQAGMKAIELHEATTISIHEIVQRFHANMSKIANLILSGALSIVGFTTPRSILTFPDNIETQDIQERIESIIADLRVLLVSRKEFQDTVPIDTEILEVLTDCFFDREQFVHAYTHDSISAEKRQDVKSPKKFEEIIKNTQVGIESDDTLKIRFPGESFKSVTSDSLGFKSSTKVWRELVNILSVDPPLFRTGPSTEKEYHARRKIMQKINKKMIDYLQKHLPVGRSPDLSLFEKVKAEGPGLYRLKFRVCSDHTDDKKYQKLSNNDLKLKIQQLSDKLACHTETENTELENEFYNTIEVAVNRGILSHESAKQIYQDSRKKDYDVQKGDLLQ